MSDGLPVEWEVGDGITYALRTFAVKDGELVSIAQRGSHWEGGVCEAVCLTQPDDPEHVVPVEGCKCGVWAYWTVADLFKQHDGAYAQYARRIITVIRMAGDCIDGEDGVRAATAQIVAWWCAEDDPKAARACAASCPGARRYHDRDVMVHIHGLRESPEEGN